MLITGFSCVPRAQIADVKKEPQQMVELRFFRFHPGKGVEPDGIILGKLEKNLVLKKTQDRQFPH